MKLTTLKLPKNGVGLEHTVMVLYANQFTEYHAENKIVQIISQIIVQHETCVVLDALVEFFGQFF